MSLKIKTAFVLGTWFGSGKAPFASGTFGSLAAIPFGLALMLYTNVYGLVLAGVVVYFIGVWATDIVMKELNIEDPGLIVIDEVVGQWIPLLIAPLDPISYALSFVFFRVFDILKPFPVGWADEKIHSATGVMLDDVFAGIYALICLKIVLCFMPEAGWLSLVS